MTNTILPQTGGDDKIKICLCLDERLMRAADAALQHGEAIEVRFVGKAGERTCRLLGRGDRPGTVRLGIWCRAGEIGRNARRLIRYNECRLPLETAIRLEQLAREQVPAATPELARTFAFIAIARTMRGGPMGAEKAQAR